MCGFENEECDESHGMVYILLLAYYYWSHYYAFIKRNFLVLPALRTVDGADKV